METLEQQLLKKKRKVEEILTEKLQDRDWFAKRVGKELIAGYDGNKANLEEIELEIEALQDFVDNTDKYLRDKKMDERELVGLKPASEAY